MNDPAQAAGAWLELAVEADPEAVEAVSEIFGRVAPGGTSVEPAFELVDEGLGARVDPTRPAIVRAYLPARDRAAAERAADEVSVALGHLQAFGLRPIGELRTRLVEEADWADAWKAYFPVMRIGRRLVIRPTWRRHRAAPDDVVLALDPGMAFGTGLHPTTRLCLAAIEVLADDGRLGGAQVLDVGCGSGILAIAALKLGAAAALGVDTDPIAIEATLANARRNRLGPSRARPRGQPAERPAGRSTSCWRTSSPGCSCRSPPALHDELRPGGTLLASGIFVDRETDVAAAFEAAGLAVARPLGRGGLGRARGRPPGLSRTSPYNRERMPVVLPGPARRAHHPGRSASSCRRSCCRSRCARGAPTVESGSPSSAGCCGPRRTARSPSGLGLALTGLGLVAALGSSLLEQPWLLLALAIYFVNLGIAFFIQRPNLRRLIGVRAAADDRTWLERAKRQRYVSYLMAGLVGTIGFLMSSKPVLW